MITIPQSEAEKEKILPETSDLDEILEKLSKQKENEFFILSQIEQNQKEESRLSKVIEDLMKKQD